MAFPNTLDNLLTGMNGTTLLADAILDHSAHHRNLGTSVNNIESFLGTNNSSNVFGGFSSGQQAVPVKSGTLGTAISGTFGSMTGGTITGNIFNTGTLGTVFVNGGTINVSVGTIGTLSGGSLTPANFQTGQVIRLKNNTQNWFIQFGTIGGTLSSGSVVTVTPVFDGTFSTLGFVAHADVVATTNNPISGYNSNPYALGTHGMNIEVRYLGGNTTDTLTIAYSIIGY